MRSIIVPIAKKVSKNLQSLQKSAQEATLRMPNGHKEVQSHTRCCFSPLSNRSFLFASKFFCCMHFCLIHCSNIFENTKFPSDSTFTCKRCRFDRFEQILKQSGAREQRATESPASLPRPIPPRIPDLPSVDRSSFSPAIGRTPRPLLDKCAICYK